MRLKTIELTWFRGAADPIALDLNCQSMVIYGENGTGKSSFVDAVEYVLNSSSIEHLKTEYSGSHQVKAIPNTHKPEGIAPALRFRFKDGSELKLDFSPNGTSKSSGAEAIAMGAWEYRQTVLRQDEVSAFVHNTKGEKYSVLLPLFGLHKMEVAAENLRKLAKSVENEAQLLKHKAKMEQVELQRKSTFGALGPEDIIKEIETLYPRYCKEAGVAGDMLSRWNHLESAISKQAQDYSADNRTHLLLKEAIGLDIKQKLDAVRAASVKVASSLDPHLVQKLEVLKSAIGFLDSLVGSNEIVECPACGQNHHQGCIPRTCPNRKTATPRRQRRIFYLQNCTR